jgi:hypothetical protein
MDNYSYQNSFIGQQTDHPSSSNIHLLGILGLVFTFVFGIAGLIMSIICLSNASKAMGEVNANPGMYTEISIGKIRTGRTCAIVGLSIQGFAVLVLLLVLATSLVA